VLCYINALILANPLNEGDRFAVILLDANPVLLGAEEPTRNTARQLQLVARYGHLADIYLVVGRAPDLARIVTLTIRHHADYQLFANDFRLEFATIIECPLDRSTNGLTAGRHFDMRIGAIVGLCFPNTDPKGTQSLISSSSLLPKLAHLGATLPVLASMT